MVSPGADKSRDRKASSTDNGFATSNRRYTRRSRGTTASRIRNSSARESDKRRLRSVRRLDSFLRSLRLLPQSLRLRFRCPRWQRLLPKSLRCSSSCCRCALFLRTQLRGTHTRSSAGSSSCPSSHSNFLVICSQCIDNVSAWPCALSWVGHSGSLHEHGGNTKVSPIPSSNRMRVGIA